MGERNGAQQLRCSSFGFRFDLCLWHFVSVFVCPLRLFPVGGGGGGDGSPVGTTAMDENDERESYRAHVSHRNQCYHIADATTPNRCRASMNPGLVVGLIMF